MSPHPDRRKRERPRVAALLRTLVGSGRNAQGTAAPVHSLRAATLPRSSPDQSWLAHTASASSAQVHRRAAKAVVSESGVRARGPWRVPRGVVHRLNLEARNIASDRTRFHPPKHPTPSHGLTHVGCGRRSNVVFEVAVRKMDYESSSGHEQSPKCPCLRVAKRRPTPVARTSPVIKLATSTRGGGSSRGEIRAVWLSFPRQMQCQTGLGYAWTGPSSIAPFSD